MAAFYGKKVTEQEISFSSLMFMPLNHQTDSGSLIIWMFSTDFSFKPACACHGDDCPIKSLWQGVEHGVRFIFLKSISQASKYQHSHAHCHTQQQQFPDLNKFRWFLFFFWYLTKQFYKCQKLLSVWGTYFFGPFRNIKVDQKLH